MSHDVEIRADRLAAAILLFGIVREPAYESVDHEQNTDTPLLTERQWEEWNACDEDDDHLAAICLREQHAHRAREWQALEFLLHVRSAPNVATPPPVPPGRAGDAAGEADALVTVPRAQAVAVASCALGWHLSPPEGGE